MTELEKTIDEEIEKWDKWQSMWDKQWAKGIKEGKADDFDREMHNLTAERLKTLSELKPRILEAHKKEMKWLQGHLDREKNYSEFITNRLSEKDKKLADAEKEIDELEKIKAIITDAPEEKVIKISVDTIRADRDLEWRKKIEDEIKKLKKNINWHPNEISEYNKEMIEIFEKSLLECGEEVK